MTKGRDVARLRERFRAIGFTRLPRGAVVFPMFFEDMPDPRQRAELVHRLDAILPPCLLLVLAGAETIADMAPTWRGSARRKAASYAASARSRTAGPRTVTSATSWPPWMRAPSSAAGSRDLHDARTEGLPDPRARPRHQVKAPNPHS